MSIFSFALFLSLNKMLKKIYAYETKGLFKTCCGTSRNRNIECNGNVGENFRRQAERNSKFLR